MKSMTGFSVETLTKDKIEYKCILKSLNSRFLEVSIKLPAELKENEGWVREKINSKFSRGKIEIELISSNKQTENLSLFILDFNYHLSHDVSQLIGQYIFCFLTPPIRSNQMSSYFRGGV